jgi:ATP-dependent helicase YprA (DUF1998 family)
VSALGDLVRSLAELSTKLPIFAALLQTVGALLIAALVSRMLYRMLQAATRRLAPGPVFLIAAIATALAYLALACYLWATGRSFEQGVVGWLSGLSHVPLDALGVAANPLLLVVFFTLIQAVYLLIVLLLAWALGLLSGDRTGGAAGAIERELGTALGERIYRLCGYHRPDAPEQRFAEWNRSLLKAMRWAKWLSLPGALTGAIPVSLWVVGAVVCDGLTRNLGLPPESPPEEARKTEQEAAAAGTAPDPSVLVRALAHDPRGPGLELAAGGWLLGRAEHLASRTRLAEESRLLRDLLSALGIRGFYVHQEAAAEALLSGKHVLMETSPISGRRTLGDVLSMHEVLLRGGSVLCLSPDAGESARRARTFREIARRSNWRWAIHHHDLGSDGRTGLHLGARQPQIVFATPESLHEDLCPRHSEWDAFLASLSLLVAIDVDRYTGSRGANLAYLMRRLARVARKAGAAPRVLATVAPFGPDVQGFAERLLGVTFEVVGPESDSRGAPTQQVVVGRSARTLELHPAVSARGVAIACGYRAEIWGYGPVLSDFEQEQQVNKVLLDFGRAVITPEETSELRFDRAEALVVRLSADKAHMTSFFTCHSGRAALGVSTWSAQEIGARRAGPAQEALPFAGFDREQAEENETKQARAKRAPELAADGGAAEDEPSELTVRADQLFALWLPDPDPFSTLLARQPAALLPQSMHPMLALGSALVAAPDNLMLARRHVLSAAAELPLLASELAELFPPGAREAIEHVAQLSRREKRVLSGDGAVRFDQEIAFDAALARGSTEAVSDEVGRVQSRADGELVLATDRARLGSVAYPGRVLVRRGRRYRVLLPEEQARTGEAVMLAEPERRRVKTARVRSLELSFEGKGHELRLAGGASLRFHRPRVQLRETVTGLRLAREGRRAEDLIAYETPIVSEYATEAALVHLPSAPPEALHGLEHLVRLTLPGFLRHAEDDVDVAVLDGPALAIVDRHPGGVGFARAVTSELLRHVLYWSREIVRACGRSAACADGDGCEHCVHGAPCLSAPERARAGRAATLALLDALLGKE